MIHTIWKYVFSLVFILLLTNSNYVIYGQSKREVSKNHVANLSRGILLVRLDNRKREVELLEKSGDYEQIKKVKERAAAQNEKIVAAFRTYYTFSKVCFYYLGESKAIVKKNNFSNVYVDLDSVLCNIDR